mmetsp:Transcript_22600/g.52680  ORF Transcript_22600/g.52680 Transcript_22600/m.52680 type:complete len:284 (+) Transcript_22600:117-968(+)
MGNTTCNCSQDSPQLVAKEREHCRADAGQEQRSTFNLYIGGTIPDFAVSTTKGDFALHDWLKGDGSCPWTALLTNPRRSIDSTDEMLEAHLHSERFRKIRTKILGISCSALEDEKQWAQTMLEQAGSEEQEFSFPVIADADGSICKTLGMLAPSDTEDGSFPLLSRCCVILFGKTVRLTTLYPANIARSFDEIFRVIASLQLTQNKGLATPVNWKVGERVIVGPGMSMEDAEANYDELKVEKLPSGKDYLRSVACPAVTHVSTVNSLDKTRTFDNGRMGSKVR